MKKMWNALCYFADFVYVYTYWACRDIKFGLLNRGKDDLLNRLLVAGHIIEKGITMPNRRYGFGYGVIRLVIGLCDRCIDKYGVEAEQLQYAIDNLDEYLKLHNDHGQKLPADIIQNIERLHKLKEVQDAKCFEISKEEFFATCQTFEEFAHSRHTSRWFTGEKVPVEVILKAVELARTAPSACNRQSVRVKILANAKKSRLLEIQNGNRGFGDKIGQVLVVTTNQIAWDYKFRTSGYVDGGIFTMQLLNSLHYYGVCACTLNAHLTISQQKEVRKLANMQDSEMFVVFIAIGMPTDKMMIAKSRRLSTDNIVEFV